MKVESTFIFEGAKRNDELAVAARVSTQLADDVLAEDNEQN